MAISSTTERVMVELSSYRHYVGKGQTRKVRFDRNFVDLRMETS